MFKLLVVILLVLPAFSVAAGREVCFSPKDTAHFGQDSILWVCAHCPNPRTFQDGSLEIEISLPAGNVILKDSSCSILAWTSKDTIEVPINLSPLLARYFSETADTSNTRFDSKNQMKNFSLIKRFWKEIRLLAKN